MVPRKAEAGTPCFLPTAIYIANNTAAGALMVILVDTLSSGISVNNVSISSIEEIDTPTLPTSPNAIGSSAS